MRRLGLWGILLGLCLVPILSANASIDDTLEQIEEASEEPLSEDKRLTEDRKFPPMRLTLQQDVEWGEFKDTDVTSFRTTATGEIRFPITKKFLASVSTRAGVTVTDFSGDNRFIYAGSNSGDPWDELHEFSLRIRTQYLIDDRWGVMLAAWMVSRWEDGATITDGMKGSGATAITYRLGDRISIAAGVAVSSRIVGKSPAVNPFGFASWKIDDRHTLSTSGLGLRLKSKWTDSVSTFVSAKYKGRRWRLDERDDGIVNRGSLRDRRVPIGVGVQWKFLKGWRLRADLGLVAYRLFKVTNEENDSVDTVTADAPGVFGSFLLQRRF